MCDSSKIYFCQTFSDKKYIIIRFQEEVIRAAGEEAPELGLLFGTENLTPQEEETDVLCFAHPMLQEFVAAKFVTQQDKVTLFYVQRC